jgi:hypothetical protein
VSLWDLGVAGAIESGVVLGEVTRLEAAKVTGTGWEDKSSGDRLSQEKKAYPCNLLIWGSLVKGKIVPTRVLVSYPPGATNGVS